MNIDYREIIVMPRGGSLEAKVAEPTMAWLGFLETMNNSLGCHCEHTLCFALQRRTNMHKECCSKIVILQLTNKSTLSVGRWIWDMQTVNLKICAIPVCQGPGRILPSTDREILPSNFVFIHTEESIQILMVNK